ncbi:1-acyl-sn-glycerol-3-phosphate acyltransferase [Oscillatoria sp. FACHB-1407]|uniref:1-acyl-sn-glycerol-3-phosphate acyltransferase n=1 Tax=Oscillatoria sp. FACHB-1407 TaxID=2692847 RepID=UPI0016892701|nr:1-acyl-sn-glycerol-3-phosphate acyltransferase [Oscillatoria sp. FACHB-1407]MBD2461367.1 1-acyl-sn-glycerol-3-phosphate acyltransferase [Oscillatoria sp. FACHB-1407]
MSHSRQRAQPPLEFIPERFNPLVLRVAHWLLPIVMRVRLRSWLPAGIAQVDVTNAEGLADLYQQFQTGKIRLVMAFRHVEVDDPLSLMFLCSRAVPRAARQKGIALQYPLHAHYMYDRGMTLWGGNWLGWLLSRLGGVPMHRGKQLDRSAVRATRKLLTDGKLPFAMAPEGQTNGHSETVSPLEPGLAQLSFWCVQDLVKEKRTEPVIVVPIGVQYHYVNPPWANLDRLLSQLEADTGLPVQAIASTTSPDVAQQCYQRICQLGEHLLTQMEQFYRRFTHRVETIPDNPTGRFDERLHIVLDRALQTAEQHFGLSSQGTVIERCRRVEEASWRDIYREDLPDLTGLSPFDRGLADWIAEAAEMRSRHMRLVESFVAVTETYVQKNPSVERLAEMAMLMFDLVARIKGDSVPARPRLGWRRVQITVGQPISVSDRWSMYERDRPSAKQALRELTQEVQAALEKMIPDDASIR